MQLKNYLHRFRQENLLMLVIIGVYNIFPVVSNISEGNALTAIAHLRLPQFFQYVSIQLAAYTAYCLMIIAKKRYQEIVTQKIDTAIRSDITGNLSRINYQDYHEKDDGIYVSWLTNDVNTINTQGITEFYAVVDGWVTIVFNGISLAFYHYSIVIVVLALSGILIELPKVFRKRLNTASLQMTKANEQLTSRITDALEGFDPLFMLNMRKNIQKQTVSASNSLAKQKVSFASLMGLNAAFINFFSVLFQIGMLGFAGWLVWRGILQVGSIITVSALASQVFGSFTALSFSNMDLHTTRPIFDKFNAVKPEDEQNKQPVSALTARIQVTQLNYTYPDSDHPILENIHFSFEQGKKYALVGDSGKGKSTLLNILAGKLLNYQGNITYDGIDYQKLSMQSLRQHLLYLDQTPYVFNDTVRNNITLGNHYHEEQLHQAIHDSQLDDLVNHLPEGIDTMLDHNGRNLSGGQRQRIALARGLISGRNIIMMDEGTSALDKKSADAIESVLVANPNITLIMVTHHLRPEIRDQLNAVYTI